MWAVPFAAIAVLFAVRIPAKRGDTNIASDSRTDAGNRMLAQRLVRAGISAPRRPLQVWLGGIVVLALFGLLVGGLVASTAAAATAVVAPAVTVITRGDRSSAAVAAAIPDLLDQLARSGRAGATTWQGFHDASTVLCGPIADDLRWVVGRLDAGEQLVPVLLDWSEHRHISPLSLLVSAVALGEQFGGAQSFALDTLARSVRDEDEAGAEARALATQSLASAALIGAAPLVFAVFLASTGTLDVRGVLATGIGQTCVFAGLGLETAGVLWMRKIVTDRC